MDVVQKRKHQPFENTVNMQLNCLIGVEKEETGLILLAIVSKPV